MIDAGASLGVSPDDQSPGAETLGSRHRHVLRTYEFVNVGGHPARRRGHDPFVNPTLCRRLSLVPHAVRSGGQTIATQSFGPTDGAGLILAMGPPPRCSPSSTRSSNTSRADLQAPSSRPRRQRPPTAWFAPEASRRTGACQPGLAIEILNEGRRMLGRAPNIRITSQRTFCSRTNRGRVTTVELT